MNDSALMYKVIEEKIDRINAELASDIDAYRQVVTEEIGRRKGWDCHYDPQTGLLQGARKLIDCDLEGYWISINFSRLESFGDGPVSIFSQEGTYPWLNYHDAISVVHEIRDIVERAASRRTNRSYAIFKN